MRPALAVVRVVAAANQDLSELVAKKLFRAVLPVERNSDLPASVARARSGYSGADGVFRCKILRRLNKIIDSIPDEVMAVLGAHDWPGNIRELQNFIERAILFSPGSVLRLPLDFKQTVKRSSESTSRTLAAAQREHILETWKQSDWMIGGLPALSAESPASQHATPFRGETVK